MDLNDVALKGIFCNGRNDILSYLIPATNFPGTLAEYIDHGLLLSGLPFTVDFVDTELHNYTVPTTLESIHGSTVMSGIIHATTVTPARSVPVHVMPAQPQTVHVMPAQMAATPEPSAEMAATPEPLHIMAATPKSALDNAALTIMATVILCVWAAHV
ncbi:hypothetical protein DPX16_15286 [Anabarilius grahami]|uniref:Uncharacterized protein n=1 Tax=Anabarilius grahami TaxID=495550 RepID=A0A3N0XVK3_ANAGA|nr:hypothetical protein DPX16_15286 [Anabarilius grahami]